MSETHIVRKVRETGVNVHLWKDGDGWTLHCSNHDRVCSWPTQKEALGFLSYPSEWCEECCQIVINRSEKNER
tara:strand:- start:346 stop:564 length:219 start_codon:yes stop_codon:yes gene_type:complete